MIHIEKLMAKFDLKGMHYSDGCGGRSALSVEEQLAAVGLAWRDAPAGFLLLLAECNDDRASLTQLMHLMFKATAELIAENWRGFYTQQAISALCVTAIMIAMNQRGRQCPECSGTGFYLRKRESRPCPACDDGVIAWTKETMHAAFSEQLPVSYKRFQKYLPYLETLSDWLCGQRTAAILLMDQRMGQEYQEARLVA
ncbi:MAG: hypothetical protein CENE_00001 [Candidatus Celerinatantimonas neptuna]|nr:MAG: hypothetical protein CENE_00001 [Candidatus Celerinatantimonas neptuna]